MILQEIIYWPSWAKALSVLLFSTAIIFIFYQAALKNKYKAYAVNTNKITELQENVKAKQQMIMILKNENSPTKKLMLTPVPAMTYLLDQFAKFSDKSKLILQLIKPLSTQNIHQLTVIPLRLAAHGQYAGIVQFLAQTNHFSSLTAIDNFQLVPLALAKSNRDELQLTIIMNIFPVRQI